MARELTAQEKDDLIRDLDLIYRIRQIDINNVYLGNPPVGPVILPIIFPNLRPKRRKLRVVKVRT